QPCHHLGDGEVVCARVLMQRYTGARPGEVIVRRPCDIDRDPQTGIAWEYRLQTHKGEHHEQDRSLFLGPRAQKVLTPFLDRHPESYCFSPSEAMAEFRARQRSAR